MMTGHSADVESTNAPGRARFQRVLQEGIWPDQVKETGVKVTTHRLQVTWGWKQRGGRSAGEKSSDNSHSNGCHGFLLCAGFYTHYWIISNPPKSPAR